MSVLIYISARHPVQRTVLIVTNVDKFHCQYCIHSKFVKGGVVGGGVGVANYKVLYELRWGDM